MNKQDLALSNLQRLISHKTKSIMKPLKKKKLKKNKMFLKY